SRHWDTSSRTPLKARGRRSPGARDSPVPEELSGKACASGLLLVLLRLQEVEVLALEVLRRLLRSRLRQIAVGRRVDGAVLLQGLLDRVVHPGRELDRIVVDPAQGRDAAGLQYASDLLADEAAGVLQHVRRATLVALGAVDG